MSDFSRRSSDVQQDVGSSHDKKKAGTNVNDALLKTPSIMSGHTNATTTSNANTVKLTLVDVETYVKFKAFDVIGNGTYRKYVNISKDKGDQWAKTMLNSIATVNSSTKIVQALVADLQSSNKTGLYTLCQTVIENNTPPIDQSTVISECSVSGKQKCQCIVLKCKGRGAPCIMVQSRFGHFVLMLWTVFKMDLVIKTLTRDFLEKVENVDDVSMGELCDQFLKETTNITKLSNAILHAIDHVRLSLRRALVC